MGIEVSTQTVIPVTTELINEIFVKVKAHRETADVGQLVMVRLTDTITLQFNADELPSVRRYYGDSDKANRPILDAAQ